MNAANLPLTDRGCSADGLQELPNLQHLNLYENPTNDLAAFRVMELLNLLPSLVDVRLRADRLSDTTAQDVLDLLKRDDLRCIPLRTECQQFLWTWCKGTAHRPHEDAIR